MDLKLSDFDYILPQEFIAQYPAGQRDLSRLLVLDRSSGKILHKNFKDIFSFIRRKDALVLNNTKVINARLFGKKSTGGKIEIFLLQNLGDGRFRVLIRPSARIKEAEGITFSNPGLKACIATKAEGENIIEFSSPPNEIEKKLHDIGEIPLPPYIKRRAETLDAERYQTVYAKVEGATAAPTAGLHFTEDILKNIASKGVDIAYVTLHVSYGTFAPIRVENIVNHKMYSEDFELTPEAAMKVNTAKERGGRIFAVGTTSCRVLEACALKSIVHSPQSIDYRVKAKKGRTDLFIYPSYKFKMVDALLTNFHLPKSTLLMLVSAFAGDVSRGRYASADKSAFAGRELILKAYKKAIAERYRFFSYGDAMLIL